jgi:hypothetical protein
MQDGVGAPSAFLGDIYTVGCPRVGARDFAMAFRNAVAQGKGKSWRVVNKNDIVTMFPKTLNWFDKNKFTHVAVGKEISPFKAPVDIKSEIPKSSALDAYGFIPSFGPHRM